MEEEFTNYIDWILEPSRKDRLLSCGKHTQITLYSNNNAQLTRFYCHNWECKNCAAKKREAIRKKMMDYSPYWYKVDFKDRNYSAVQKQIKRDGAEYVALGTGSNTTIFVNKKLDNTEFVGFQKLANSIEEILQQPSEPRQKRFKHSRGLFQSEEKPESKVHLSMEAFINESVKDLVDLFSSKGYSFNSGFGGYYVDLGEDARNKLDGILEPVKGKIEYIKYFQNTDRDKNSEANEADE